MFDLASKNVTLDILLNSQLRVAAQTAYPITPHRRINPRYLGLYIVHATQNVSISQETKFYDKITYLG